MPVHKSLARASTLAFLLAGTVATVGLAQQRDPRIGEWREERYPGAVGLYTIYEDLGNGLTRVHFTENLAIANRWHQDQRCDGNLYPYVDAAGMPIGRFSSCTIVDARTVQQKLVRETPDGREEGEVTWTLSDDGNRFIGLVTWRNAVGEIRETRERRFTRNAENCLNHAREGLFRECAVRTQLPRN